MNFLVRDHVGICASVARKLRAIMQWVSLMGASFLTGPLAAFCKQGLPHAGLLLKTCFKNLCAFMDPRNAGGLFFD